MFAPVSVAGVLLVAAVRAGPAVHTIALFAFVLAAQLFAAIVFHFDADRKNSRNRNLVEFTAETNRAILLNEGEGKIFEAILDYGLRILDKANLGTVLTFDETGALVIAASRGFDEDFIRDFRLPLEESFIYRQTGGMISGPVIISMDTIRSPSTRFEPKIWKFKSIISAPIFVDGKLHGLINFDSDRRGTFDDEDLEAVRKFSAQIEVSILARKRFETTIAESRVDRLTGFFTRTRFEELFELAAERAQRYGEGFVLGMFDVDELKKVNDGYGHLAGDRLLKSVADAIRNASRKSDLLGRFGGDEFVGLFSRADIEFIRSRADALLASFRDAPLDLGGTTLVPRFSCGFASYPEDGRTLEALMSAADNRLYVVKASHRSDVSPEADPPA
ncbi:MAG: sensor domain-containing diguanylate cyclase [Spirochaetes bacterium]|nr:sensor domain-containing diguanylate cyclase [Spirochaetota bacterium]